MHGFTLRKADTFARNACRGVLVPSWCAIAHKTTWNMQQINGSIELPRTVKSMSITNPRLIAHHTCQYIVTLMLNCIVNGENAHSPVKVYWQANYHLLPTRLSGSEHAKTLLFFIMMDIVYSGWICG